MNGQGIEAQMEIYLQRYCIKMSPVRMPPSRSHNDSPSPKLKNSIILTPDHSPDLKPNLSNNLNPNLSFNPDILSWDILSGHRLLYRFISKNGSHLKCLHAKERQNASLQNVVCKNVAVQCKDEVR